MSCEGSRGQVVLLVPMSVIGRFRFAAGESLSTSARSGAARVEESLDKAEARHSFGLQRTLEG